MPPVYRIHPGIGIARMGNSPDEFCISPEEPAVLPVACDEQGNPLLTPDGRSEARIRRFKDDEGRIKRQAARFQVYVYDEDDPGGRPLKPGDRVEGGGNEGVLVNILWRVYLANKKASWYEFEQLEGEHGYAPDHPRRNAGVTDAAARQRLIIDPGPQLVNCTDRRSAHMSRDSDNLYAPIFPPPLEPYDINTLGELKTDDDGRLLVLGGFGHSGSFRKDGFGEPLISHYANNDGWFDDTSDGPVMARLVMYSPNVDRHRFIDVDYPAWCVVGYPAYVPEVLDMVTLDDVIYDLSVRRFATRTELYGEAGTFADPPYIPPSDTAALIHWRSGRLEWNRDFEPWFYRDIWPILFRADEFTYMTNVLAQSNFPHNQSARGNFDPDRLGVPPVVNRRALAACERDGVGKQRDGTLFLEALDPSLTLIDSQAGSTLRVMLDEFEQEVDQLIQAETARGTEFEPEDLQLFKTWMDDVRGTYPEELGDLLFRDLRGAAVPVRRRLRDAAGSGDGAEAESGAGPDENGAHEYGRVFDDEGAQARTERAPTHEGSQERAPAHEGTQGRAPAHEGSAAAMHSAVGPLFQAFAATLLSDSHAEPAATGRLLATARAERGPATDRLTHFTRAWKDRYRESDAVFTRARMDLEKGVLEAVREIRKKAADAWRDHVSRLDDLFSRWGSSFRTAQKSLLAFTDRQDGEAGESALDTLFERLHSYVETHLDAYVSGRLLDEYAEGCVERCTYDPYRRDRAYLHSLLRQPGEENQFRLGGRPNNRLYHLPLMPLLAGDNPISNTLPSKFLRLTDYQLFILRQWADGRFINEKMEGWDNPDPYRPYAGWVNRTGRDLDRAVLTSILGGALCPGGEVGWIMRNPAVYLEPYRIKADPDFYAFRQTAAQANAKNGQVEDEAYAAYTGIALSQDDDFGRGMQPGDLTKHMALPWQADFNECSLQDINITYEEWNNLYPDSGDDSLLAREEKTWSTLWWPAHRPLQAAEFRGMSDGKPVLEWLGWSRGIPQTPAGDQKMVTAWPDLGFLIRNRYAAPEDLDKPSPIDDGTHKYISVERNDEDIR